MCNRVAAEFACVAFFGWFHGTVHGPAKAQKRMKSVLSFKKYFVVVFSVINF